MGAFCVFGVSRSVCLAAAEKATPTYVLRDGKREDLTMAEWAARRDRAAAAMFETSEKPVKVSPEFDAPQFCEDWLAADPAHVRMAQIRVRGGKLDKLGNPVLRNGQQVLTWLPYPLEVAE